MAKICALGNVRLYGVNLNYNGVSFVLYGKKHACMRYQL